MTSRSDRLYADDPLLPPRAAAAYLGVSLRTLERLRLRRTPLPGTGTQRIGYRRSVLNAMLDERDALLYENTSAMLPSAG